MGWPQGGVTPTLPRYDVRCTSSQAASCYGGSKSRRAVGEISSENIQHVCACMGVHTCVGTCARTPEMSITCKPLLPRPAGVVLAQGLGVRTGVTGWQGWMCPHHVLMQTEPWSSRRHAGLGLRLYGNSASQKQSPEQSAIAEHVFHAS